MCGPPALAAAGRVPAPLRKVSRRLRRSAAPIERSGDGLRHRTDADVGTASTLSGSLLRMGKKASGAEPKAGAPAAKRARPSAADGADIDVLFAALPKRTQSRPAAVINGAPAGVGGVAKAQDSRGRRAGGDDVHPGARADHPRREAAPKRGSAHYLDTGERLVPVRYAWLVFLPRGEAAPD